MRIAEPGSRVPAGSCLTLGTFDGLHRAHQVIIEELEAEAKALRSETGLVTFEPSPQLVLHKEFPFILTPLAEKKQRLERLGLDFLYLVPFDQTLRQTPAAQFLEETVLRPLKPRLILVGYDHRFGIDRTGDTQLLASLEAKYGFRLRVLPEYRFHGEEVKSTGVRERLLLGAVRQAGVLLGYRYRVNGRVVRGQGIGASLGFPTANIAVEPPEKLIPAPGVYAAFARLDDDQPCPAECSLPAAQSVVNIGFRPTFSGDRQTVEAHLLDAPARQLYGRVMTLEFIERLRPEIKFHASEQLSSQIAADIVLARLLLSENG